MKIYQALAARLEAYRNCVAAGNKEWKRRHLQAAEQIVVDHLPHGSGIDGDVELLHDDCKDDRIMLFVPFHHMDENGSYDGWTEHVLTIRPTFSGIDIKVGGRDRNDIKDYLHQLFYHSLTCEMPEPEATQTKAAEAAEAALRG